MIQWNTNIYASLNMNIYIFPFLVNFSEYPRDQLSLNSKFLAPCTHHLITHCIFRCPIQTLTVILPLTWNLPSYTLILTITNSLLFITHNPLPTALMPWVVICCVTVKVHQHHDLNWAKLFFIANDHFYPSPSHGAGHFHQFVLLSHHRIISYFHWASEIFRVK